MQEILANVIRSRTTQIIVALVVVAEIYRLGILGAWQGSAEVQDSWAQLDAARQAAIKSAPNRQGDTGLSSAETTIAAAQARADADKLEAEIAGLRAEISRQSKVSPASIAKLREDAKARLQVLAIYIGLPMPSKLGIDPPREQP